MSIDENSTGGDPVEFLICRFGKNDFSRRAYFMNADKTRKQSPLERELASGKPVVTTTLGNSMEPLATECQYAFSDEDFYVYLISHTYKHYKAL